MLLDFGSADHGFEGYATLLRKFFDKLEYLPYSLEAQPPFLQPSLGKA